MVHMYSSCNMGTSDLPEIYTRARGRSPSASVYISGKSQVPMLQLIYSTWVNHLQAAAEEVVDMRGGSAELTQTYFYSLVR